MERNEESDKGIDLNGVPCSICLDLVTYGGERSWAKLQCGHEFHLDCIGSAFNVKGIMQCPNCRKIEEGQWLYANGSANLSPELTMDDSSIDHPFHFGYTEMPYRVHICPFRGLTQVHPSPESSLGIMSTITPMVNHQHPHPQGWLQFHHAPMHHHHPLPSRFPMPVATGAGRSLPRFTPSGRVYDPSGGFSPYGEAPPMNYSHSWVGDNNPHFQSH